MPANAAYAAWCASHPRLFWSRADEPALNAKLQHPRLAPFLDAARQACARYADPANAEYLNTALGRADLIGDGLWGGTLFPKLDKALLLVLATADEAWTERLIRIVRTLTTDEEPARAFILARNEGLETFAAPERPLIAAQAGLLPLLYDALHDRMPQADREAARRFLRTRVAEPFVDYVLGEKVRQLSLGMNIAWWDFQAGLWSLAAVCEPDSERDLAALREAGDQVRRGLHMGVDETGVIGEGPFYGCIDLAAWLTTAEVLARAGVCDLWQEESSIRSVMRARLYYALPGLHGLLPHGDASRNEPAYGSVQPLLLSARRLDEPALQTLWDGLVGDRPLVPGVHGPLGVLMPWLWYDVRQQAEPLQASDWPHTLGGGRWGVNFVRSGWGDDDLFFALFGAGRDPGTFIHQHVDAGHIALAALGEVFCTGRGYGHTNAVYQNVMLPGGREPAGAPGCVGQMWRGGTVLAFASGEWADYACVDVTWQWQSEWYRRHALVVRAPGAEPYVLVLDNCNQASDWLTWDWAMQLEKEHQAELDPQGQRASVQGRVHRLELAWAHPREQDYPRPHRLELLTDRTPVPDRKHLDKSEGKGYPRLVARLHGFNGMLLSALVPRRAGTPAAGIERIAARYQFGLVIDHGDVVDTVVAAPIDRHIRLAGLEGEATLAIVRRDRQGALLWAAAADSFALSVDGRAVQPRRGEAADLCEWRP